MQGCVLSEEQRARILASHRAAKARLARKSVGAGAPLDQRKSPDRKKVCGVRPPLADVDVNAAVGGGKAEVSTVGPRTSLGAFEDFDDFDEDAFEEIDRLCSKRNEDARDGGSAADMPTYLRKLNVSQRDAALSSIGKPLLIVAGPGSGKTSTMVARILTLLNEGVDSKNILGMTFTTAAATEMMDRVAAVVGKEASKELMISTFHSFCLQLCRSHAEKLNRTSEFLVYGASQQRKAVIEATRLALEATESCDAQKPEVWRERAKKWQRFVTQAKASGQDSEQIEKSGNHLGADILRHYERILASCNSLDYHDFIGFAVKLLTDHPDVSAECHNTWAYVLVDEFQDTSVMQYKLLRLLSLHGRVTVVGDDDQSIFSFNGANSLGFSTFRNDFPNHKEVRLHQNYRSTGCIVEAARCVIQNNDSGCSAKVVRTDNDFGEKIVVMECRNEEAQCAFVVDEILEKASMASDIKPVFANFAILYRRQVTGKIFQSAFRSRKIPFNMHGVAVYRKKVVKDVIALLWTSLGRSGTVFERRVFKALYGGDKTETKKAVEYVEKYGKNENCSFLEAAEIIFTAKVSGTFSRRQLSQGRKVLTTVEMVKRLAAKEQSLSSLVTAVLNMLPQRRAFESRAIVDESGGKLLNEDEDCRTVLDYLLDDVSEFLCKHIRLQEEVKPNSRQLGCSVLLKDFLDHITVRETENFRTRREENHNSVTLTTMHQSKGLEWDSVFIVKANELETPLLHESSSLEVWLFLLRSLCRLIGIPLQEERRLFYVAMTRARKKLYIVYIVVNPQRQILQPSRFLSELPRQHLQFEGLSDCPGKFKVLQPPGLVCNSSSKDVLDENALTDSSAFLRSFNIEARSTIASIFHQWAKKSAFQDPKRLLMKVGLAIDERLRSKTAKNKDTLHALKRSLTDDAAFAYADQIVKWEKLPAHERSVHMAERQEYFQQKCSERTMGSVPATAKQIAFLRSFGCTVNPSSRLHASKLIEQYKAL
ncbi:ATP-dependent DNA helicase SRS2-like protein At4g25120 isoform X1 [Selaginella moellendorffii]|uniref:ATP-dependent DNA helicase SRS2-like protein At4g25120 isoform X1 n=2 Tax=Selaginella moellendorffii TaxID=88036 RepID=UPI000D1C697C|nr:ATP-dependent DNA helicase SRS2-like protein At4g25120 isoform X1 [Selaginella moellendorffii]|eukprot:XP_024520223.1 ATP-dependent DNA helicase SRS2-like protein At4g25120 isoform X1 [Selaginella moellendorffii]